MGCLGAAVGSGVDGRVADDLNDAELRRSWAIEPYSHGSIRRHRARRISAATISRAPFSAYCCITPEMDGTLTPATIPAIATTIMISTAVNPAAFCPTLPTGKSNGVASRPAWW